MGSSLSQFRGPAQHLLFTESSASCIFVILLSTYSLQSHLHPAIQYPLPVLTPYQFNSTMPKGSGRDDQSLS